MIHVTPEATEQIEKLCKEQEKDYIRLSVVGGGCSGYQYSMTFDEKRENDEQIGKLIVDPISFSMLDGLMVEWMTTIQGSAFTFNNPNAARTCGCGKSFA